MDSGTWKLLGEGIGIGGGGFATAVVAAIFGLPAIRDGLRQLGKLTDRMEAALEKLAESMAALEKRVSALEITQTVALALHHGPDSLERVSEGAESIMHARDEMAASGETPQRRAEDRDHGKGQ